MLTGREGDHPPAAQAEGAVRRLAGAAERWGHPTGHLHGIDQWDARRTGRQARIR